MTVTAVGNELFGFVERVVEVIGFVHSEHGRKLFVRERLAYFDRADLADEYPRRFGNFESAEPRDVGRALTDYLGVDRTVDKDRRADLVGLLSIEEVRAAERELGLERVVHVGEHYRRLLGRAYHAVVERLGMEHRRRGELDVRRRIDDNGRVAGTDADRGLARGVRRFDHARSACRKDNVATAHDRRGKRDGRLVYPADKSCGRACGDSRVEHGARRRYRAVLSAGMRREYKTVAGLEREQCLEYSRGRGVGRRHYRGDNADGLGVRFYAVSLVDGDNVARLDVAVRVIDVFRGIVVFDDLVLDNTHSRFRDRHFGEIDTRLVCGGSGSEKDLIDLLLRKRSELGLRLPHAREQLGESLFVLDNQFVHRTSVIVYLVL